MIWVIGEHLTDTDYLKVYKKYNQRQFGLLVMKLYLQHCLHMNVK